MWVIGFVGVGFLWAWLRMVEKKQRVIPATARTRLTWDIPPSKILEMMDYLSPMPGRLAEAVTTAVVEAVEAVKVFFKPGEPQRFEEYDGQAHVVGYLSDAVRGLSDSECALEPQLFLGLAGMGKTLLAKVVANELVVRAERVGLPAPQFLEIFPADLPDVAALDDVLRRVAEAPCSVMFIDEIHDLSGPHTRKLYLVLEEGRYQFRGDPAPTILPPITLLGATTDYGSLHPALKRRWIKHMFKPATPEQLVGYVRRRPFPIADAVAWKIVERTKFSGAPWEALEIYRMAVTTAKGRGALAVEDPDVDRVFELQELDMMGLRWLDRKVIEVLLTQPKFRREKKEEVFVCFAASEQNVCTLAGLDKGEYREGVRPRLMSRGLLEVRPYFGQALTVKGVQLYANLKSKTTT